LKCSAPAPNFRAELGFPAGGKARFANGRRTRN
jgi:hypothetical protein